jgi:hypothetical protein
MIKYYNKLSDNMGFLDKVLKIESKEGHLDSSSSIYEVLFNKIESSIKSSNPSISQKDLFANTKEIYLEICKCLDCKCIDDIYKPINNAIPKTLSSKNEY